jgi:rSAM/selenodomain-associated transferase 2
VATTDDAAIAVVIPTLDEARTIAGCLAHLAQFEIAEIVVCDGGSVDETRAIVADLTYVRVISASRGRGSQFAAGIAATTAPIIVLLHADTILPPQADRYIRSALADPAVAGGCFRLRFDSRRASLRFWAWFSRFETALTTFGDQAFFVRRSALAAAGGMVDWPLLEDVEVRRRLKRVGRFVKLQPTVVTSARRFERDGVLRGQLRNAFILGALRLGVSPQRLAAIYRATSH